MTGELNTLLKRLVDGLFQPISNPYRCIAEQCEMAMDATEVFMKYLSDGNKENLTRIETIYKHKNRINSQMYNFMSRDSERYSDIKAIYLAFLALDMVISHIRITIMEIKIQQLIPDEHMLQMARFLKVGIDSLQLGFKQITANRVYAQESALVARNAANDTRIAFTRALADIILTEEHTQRLTSSNEGVNDKITTVSVANLKRRMIYSQLSKTADRVSWASTQLYGLSVKYH